MTVGGGAGFNPSSRAGDSVGAGALGGNAKPAERIIRCELHGTKHCMHSYTACTVTPTDRRRQQEERGDLVQQRVCTHLLLSRRWLPVSCPE